MVAAWGKCPPSQTHVASTVAVSCVAVVFFGNPALHGVSLFHVVLVVSTMCVLVSLGGVHFLWVHVYMHPWLL